MLKRLALIIALSLAACGVDSDDKYDAAAITDSCVEAINKNKASVPTPGFTLAEVEGVDNRTECGVVDLEITGDFDAKVTQRELVVGTTTYLGGKLPASTTFLGMAMADFLPLENGTKFRVSFNTSPGIYKGTGKYTLGEANQQLGEGLNNPIPSNVIIEVVTPISATQQGVDGVPPPFVMFERPAEEICELEASVDTGSAGKLYCDRLKAPDGRQASLTWSWTTHRIP